MALQTSGQISLNDIHVEAGGSSGTQAAINDSDIRGLIGKASGAQMSFSEWYGASNITVSHAQTVTGDTTPSNTSRTLTLTSVAVGDVLVLQMLSNNLKDQSVSTYRPSFSGSWSTAHAGNDEWVSGGATYSSSRIYYRRVNATSEKSYTVSSSSGNVSADNIGWILHRFNCNASSVTHNDVETEIQNFRRGTSPQGTNVSKTINAGSAGGAAIAIVGRSYYSTNGTAMSFSPTTNDYNRISHFVGSVSRNDVWVRSMNTGSNITVGTGQGGNGSVGIYYTHCYLTMS